MSYGYHLLFMAAIVAALGISGYRSGTMIVQRGLPVRRAVNPRLFVFSGIVLGVWHWLSREPPFTWVCKLHNRSGGGQGAEGDSH